MRVSFEWILYYLQLTFVGIFVLVLCAYQMEVKQKDFLKRGMYSDHVQGMQLSSAYLSSAHGETVDFSIPRLDGGDFMIYKRLSEEYNEIVRGVYGTKDLFDFSSYLQSGKFFQERDYKNKTATAVIGSSMLDRVYTKNGKWYVGYDSQLMENNQGMSFRIYLPNGR